MKVIRKRNKKDTGDNLLLHLNDNVTELRQTLLSNNMD
jgi:hypothetical protein